MRKKLLNFYKSKEDSLPEGVLGEAKAYIKKYKSRFKIKMMIISLLTIVWVAFLCLMFDQFDKIMFIYLITCIVIASTALTDYKKVLDFEELDPVDYLLYDFEKERIRGKELLKPEKDDPHVNGVIFDKTADNIKKYTNKGNATPPKELDSDTYKKEDTGKLTIE